MSLLWIIFAALVVIVSACDVVALLHDRQTLLQTMPKGIWWLKLVCNALVVCAAIGLMLVRTGATS